MKVAIVGAGAIARRGHIPVYHKMAGYEIVSITDISEKLVQDVAREFGIPKYHTSIESLISSNEDIDVIDICVPTQTHVEIVKQVAPLKKHILLEKPVANNLKDALRIKKYVNENGIKLCVIHNYRYFKAVNQAMQRIKGGFIGDIVSLHAWGITNFPTHWTLNPWLYHKGGTLYDFGPHLVDMVLLVKQFAPIQTVYAAGGDFTGGDMGFINYSSIIIGFEDRSTASLDISWISGTSFKFLLDIYGTAGNLVLDIRNNFFSENRGFPTPIDDTRAYLKKIISVGTGVINGSFFRGSNELYEPLFSDFEKAIRENREAPVTLEQGIQTSAVLEAIERSIAEKRPVYLQELIKETEAEIAKS